MRGPRWIAAGAALVMVVGGASVVSATNPAPESWAFVARGDNPVDALSAASLAGTLNAPVILTEQSVLTQDAADALEDADPDNVVIAGGLVAITGDVESRIRSQLPDADVRRIAGESRYDTSQQLAELLRELDPSFLAVDGKANSAELADKATLADTATKALDSDALGGLAADEYTSVVGSSPGSRSQVPLLDESEDLNVLIDLLDPIEVTVPADGVLKMNAGALMNSNSDSDAGVVVLLDYDGPDQIVFAPSNIDGVQAFYDALVDLRIVVSGTGSAAASAAGARSVTAGTHEVRYAYAYIPDGDTADDEVSAFLLPHLDVEFVPNGAVDFTPVDAEELLGSSRSVTSPRLFGLFGLFGPR